MSLCRELCRRKNIGAQNKPNVECTPVVMLVSVIVPNYNHAIYLKARLDSILTQIYQNIELIILDDASTDDSRTIISEYSEHPKVSTIVLNEENSGSVFAQWNRGIQLATGDIIWIAESDDVCEPSFLTEVVTQFLESDNTVIAYVQSVSFDNNALLDRSFAWKMVNRMDGVTWIKQHMLGSCALINASSAIFRKSAYLSVTDTYLTYKQCGDWALWVEIASRGEVVISGKYLNYFRRHSANTTSQNWKNGLYYIEGADIIKNIIKTYSLPENMIRSALTKILLLLESERNIYSRQLYQQILEQLKNISPRLVQSIYAKILWNRKKEKFKKIVRKTLQYSDGSVSGTDTSGEG